MDFNLRERTALIYGPFSSTVQGLMMGLTQMGADCVLLETDNAASVRFCNQLNDAREVNLKYGRAMSIKNPLVSEMDIRDAIGSAAQSFGSVDLYIDAKVVNKQNRFKIGESIAYLDEEIHENFKTSVMLTHTVLSFMKNRKRGRVLFLMNDIYSDPIMAGTRGGLITFAQALAKQVQEHQVTVNCLTLGLTEEWVLAQYPEAKSIKEAIEIIRLKDPGIRIAEPEKITNAVAFLLSQAGASLTAQNIKLT